MKCGLIYKAVCPNGKYYIGQTVQSFSERIRCHKKDSFRRKDIKFYRALRKYGFDNFKWEIIEDNIPQEFLNIKECEYIQIFDSYKNGYNSTLGGDFQPMNNPLIVEKVANFNRGRKRSAETRKKISESKMGMHAGENNPMFGKRGEKHPSFGKSISQEQKDKISLANKGRKRPDVSARFKGRIISEEHRKKLSRINFERNKTCKRDSKGRYIKNV